MGVFEDWGKKWFIRKFSTPLLSNLGKAMVLIQIIFLINMIRRPVNGMALLEMQALPRKEVPSWVCGNVPLDPMAKKEYMSR